MPAKYSLSDNYKNLIEKLLHTLMVHSYFLIVFACYLFLSTCILVYTYTSTYVCMYVYMYVCISEFSHMYVLIQFYP